MIIFEGDKFLFLSRSVAGKMGTERKRGAEFPLLWKEVSPSFRFHAEGG